MPQHQRVQLPLMLVVTSRKSLLLKSYCLVLSKQHQLTPIVA